MIYCIIDMHMVHGVSFLIIVVIHKSRTFAADGSDMFLALVYIRWELRVLYHGRSHASCGENLITV